ncbi:MAG TPA: Cache 3/Cache 2 fusion domain-containing protein, partial [Fibrobacteria bacterium]|nr:Cache 3/Cache 2 fusion domain-containing protein [Fibrobacteria bacterium]
MKIRTRLQIAILGGGTTMFLALGIAIDVMLGSAFEKVMRDDIKAQSQWAATLCDLSYQDRLTKLDHDLKVFQQRAEQVFVLKSGKRKIEAIDQTNQAPAMLEVVNASVDGKPVESGDHAMVDEVKRLTGTDATLFLVAAEGMVRVSTTVLQPSGERAIGTFIPSSSPVFQTITAGKPYSGRAVVAGQDYITCYAPVKDPAGK